MFIRCLDKFPFVFLLHLVWRDFPERFFSSSLRDADEQMKESKH